MQLLSICVSAHNFSVARDFTFKTLRLTLQRHPAWGGYISRLNNNKSKKLKTLSTLCKSCWTTVLCQSVSIVSWTLRKNMMTQLSKLSNAHSVKSLAAFLFRSNTHFYIIITYFYDPFAFSNAFLKDLAQRLKCTPNSPSILASASLYMHSL